MNKTLTNNKIIQLGYTINNAKDGRVLVQRRIYINPNEQITEFIQQLTGIYQQQVDMGVTLQEAYQMMVEDISKHQVSKFPLQWGLDHYELRQQLGLEWNDYVFSRRCIDIKALYQAYAMARPNGKTVAGLGKACEVLGVEFEGRQHDALNDAVATFKVYRALVYKMIKYDELQYVINNRNKKEGLK